MSLSHKQKREAILAALRANFHRSDREIGRQVGVDHKSVGKLRKLREEIPEEPGKSEAAAPTPNPAAPGWRVLTRMERPDGVTYEYVSCSYQQAAAYANGNPDWRLAPGLKHVSWARHFWKRIIG